MFFFRIQQYLLLSWTLLITREDSFSYYRVTKIGFIIESKELELETMTVTRHERPTPSRDLVIVIPFSNTSNLLIVARKSFRQTFHVRRNVDDHPHSPRHERSTRIRSIDVLNHQGQWLGTLGNVVPITLFNPWCLTYRIYIEFNCCYHSRGGEIFFFTPWPPFVYFLGSFPSLSIVGDTSLNSSLDIFLLNICVCLIVNAPTYRVYWFVWFSTWNIMATPGWHVTPLGVWKGRG